MTPRTRRYLNRGGRGNPIWFTEDTTGAVAMGIIYTNNKLKKDTILFLGDGAVLGHYTCHHLGKYIINCNHSHYANKTHYDTTRA